MLTSHFYTQPGLGWQALLKTVSEYCEHEAKCKDCELCLDRFKAELHRDMVMLLMFEKGSWDGTAQSVKRFAKANNKYLKDQYKADGTSTYLQCLEGSNFYWLAMTEKLPTDKIVREKKFDDFTVTKP